MAEETTGKTKEENQSETEGLAMENGTTMNRKEKRKALKKMKRKQIRKDMAVKEREKEEAKLNDPQEQMKIELMEREEAERCERERKEFEEREKAWLEAMEMRKKKMIEEEEEEQRRKALDEEFRRQQAEIANDGDEDDDWEYVEEGPAEIIWQGNEIIVKKKKVRVPKKNSDQQSREEDADRPTSNPLPPQSEAFVDYRNGLVCAQHAIENVAQQVPNFGTEQDKAHCPFHLKTGACRFGQRCSRVHFYPDKACTILIKNMYNGPGLAWEQDEGLEFVGKFIFPGVCEAVWMMMVITSKYTDEEVERSYEEFYEDVHTEFLKFGEIVNFKVCRNGSFHLRGNVYIHYKYLDSAVLAYHSINGRYFAGKQVLCEFVNVTRWKVAICGDYMKSRFKTCSHGTACNFIHCFRNPGGDYEWADGDKPPPKYWVQKMAALFGHSDDSVYGRKKSQENFGQLKSSSKMSAAEADRYCSRRSRSREMDSTNHRSSGRRNDDEKYFRSNCQRSKSDYKEQNRSLVEGLCKQSMNSKDDHYRKRKTHYKDIEGEMFDNVRDADRDEHHDYTRKSSRWQGKNSKNRSFETDSDGGWSDVDEDIYRNHDHARRSSKNGRMTRYLDDYGEHENKNDEVDNYSDKGRRDSYHDKKRKSSGHRRKVEYPDSHGDKENRDHDTEGGWSHTESYDDAHRLCSKRSRDDDADKHHSKRRKSLVHSSKVSKFSDEHGDSKDRIHGTDFNDDWLDKNTERHHSHTRGFPNEGSDISEDQGARRMKTGGCHMSEEISKADSSNENLRSDWSHEPSSSDQYDARDRSHDLDFRHNSEVKFDKQDRWESGECSADTHSKSREKVTSFNRLGRYSGREKSYDCVSESHHHDKLDHEDCWNSEEVASKKSSNLDSSSKRSTKIDDKVRRSKSSSQSSHRRHLDKERDSFQDNKDSEKNF